MKKLLSTLFISTALLFVGCEGDEGPQGPAGPAGADGNANVKTDIFVIEGSTDWTNNQGTYIHFHSTSLLTQEIIDNGIVHVYIKGERVSNGEPTWISLPYSANGASIQYWLHDNQLEITTNVDYSALDITVRLITVEGDLVSTAKVDFNNYEEVKAHFDLED